MGRFDLEGAGTETPVRLVVRVARRLLDRREKIQMSIVLLLVLLGVGLEVVSLGLFLPAISLLTDDGLLGRARGSLPAVSGWSDAQLVVGFLSMIVLVFVVKNAFAVGALWFQRTVIARISTRLTQELFDRYLHQNYLFHVRSNSAVLIRNMQNASTLISSGIDPLISLSTDGLIAIGIITLLIVVEPIPAFVVLGLYGTVGFGLYRTLRRRVRELGSRRNEHNAMTLKHQQQGFSAIKTLIISGHRDAFSREHLRHISSNNLITRTYGLIQQLPRIWIELLTVSSLALLVSIVVLQGRSVAESLPILGLFAVAAFRIQPSVTRIVLSLQALSFASAAVATVDVDLAGPRPLDDDRPSEPLAFESLRLDRVSFSYNKDAGPILWNVSLRIDRGELVGICGRSGAGKTTLVDVMLGLLTPNSGAVLVNDKDVAAGPQRWQRSIGFVPQDVYLVDDSIERNVAFGMRINDEVKSQVLVALDAARLSEFVLSLPRGVESVVGERGTRLSGGQRQRIGIARALMGSPQVMVFDEATSSLDPETEQEVLAAIDAAAGEKTGILIAHRTSTLAICDRILRVEGGDVIDLGPPTSELLARLGGEIDRDD